MVGDNVPTRAGSSRYSREKVHIRQRIYQHNNNIHRSFLQHRTPQCILNVSHRISRIYLSGWDRLEWQAVRTLPFSDSLLTVYRDRASRVDRPFSDSLLTVYRACEPCGLSL